MTGVLGDAQIGSRLAMSRAVGANRNSWSIVAMTPAPVGSISGAP